MLGVCTKPAATVANEAVVAVSIPPANEPVNDPVILEPATVEVLVKVIVLVGVGVKVIVDVTLAVGVVVCVVV